MALLTDEEISKFLDGEGDPSVIERVEREPEAAAQVAHARRVERALRRHLHRWDCPEEQRLIDYSFELLHHDERATIERHLEYCLRCRAELVELERFLDDDAPRRTNVPLTDIFQGYQPSGIPLVPLELEVAYRYRGGVDPASLVAAAHGATLFLELERVDLRLLLTGLLVTDDPEDQARWKGALVEVRQEGRLLGAIFISDAGDFALEIDSADSLQIRVTRDPDHSLLLEDVTLTPAD